MMIIFGSFLIGFGVAIPHSGKRDIHTTIIDVTAIITGAWILTTAINNWK